MITTDRRMLQAFTKVAVCAGAFVLLLTGCVFRTVRQQQERIDVLCRISGSVKTEHESDNPIFVGLFHREAEVPELVDLYALEGPGRWIFGVRPGTYGLGAFEDVNGDLKYKYGEPVLRLREEHSFTCAPGEAKDDITLVIPTKGPPAAREIDVEALWAEAVKAFLEGTEEEKREREFFSLGLVTALGARADLGDPRFKAENGEKGLWRPLDFILDVQPGVYFLADYDKDKIPVLFVHGVSGTPLHFKYLIEHLDQGRFQPWVYYYPSGARLDAIAKHLNQVVAKLHVKHKFDKVFVVAYSMGGLVSRAYILGHYRGNCDDTGEEHCVRAGKPQIPLFVSISTPWGGHEAAETGVKYAPAVIRSWRDVAPNSDFLRQIFYETDPKTRQVRRRPLPEHMSHHLLFGFKRNDLLPGVSGDAVITLASQLRWEAQQDAERIYGFDCSHTGIITSPDVSELLNRILAHASQ